MNKKTTKTTTSKKTAKKSSIAVVDNCPLQERFNDTLESQQEQFYELKERFDSLDGSIPYIQNSIDKIEHTIDKIDAKFEKLYDLNQAQDKEVNNIQIRLGQVQKVMDGLERIIIIGFSTALITALVGAFVTKLF